jgi:two-component sensor histidine kinase
VKGDAVEVDIDRALSCGLICNELMTNSLKYAFTTSQEERVISFTIEKKDRFVVLNVSDNGAQSLGSSAVKKSFGLRFTDQLVVSKLKGTWRHWINNGFHVSIQIPIHANGKS